MKGTKKSKKVVIIGLVITVVFSFLILNCSIIPASAAEPIILALAPAACAPPPTGGMTLMISEQMKLLEKRTDGRIKVDIYWGQSLAKQNDLVKAIETGICDIAKLNPQNEPGKIPLSSIGQLPGTGTHMWPIAMAYRDAMKEGPLRDELNKHSMRPLTLTILPSTVLVSKMPIRTVAEMKGKKLSAFGIYGQIISSLGAVPIAMAPGEQYDGLKKGTIDGNTCPKMAVVDFKFYESCKYYTDFQFGFAITPMVIREETFTKLPADIQKIMTDSELDLLNKAYEVTVEEDSKTTKVLKENNVEFFEPSDADKAAVLEAQTKICDKWAEDMENKGLPGKKFLSDFRAIVAKYEKINPHK